MIDGQEKITIDDFKKIDIRAGTIIAARVVPEADTLLQLTVDLGEEVSRTIVSGIRAVFPEPEMLVGTQALFVANLEPRTIKGFVSNGMILAGRDAGGAIVLIRPERLLPTGMRIG